MPKCVSCGAEIQWLKTEAGNRMPVDAGQLSAVGATVFDPKTMISHFATCPNAAQHRKKK